MVVKFSDIKKSYSDEKRNSDRAEWFAYYLIRPISFYISLLFIRINMSANSVTILSLFVSLTASVMIGFGDYRIRLAGCFGLLVWLILDHVDGNIARYNKTQSSYGEFLDALSGYFTVAFFPIFLGLAAYFDNYDTSTAWIFLFMGGITSINNILPRLVYQKFRNYNQDDNGYKETETNVAKEERSYSVGKKSFSLINNLLNPSGFLFVIVLAVVLFHVIEVFLIIYSILALLVTIYFTLKFSKRMHILSK